MINLKFGRSLLPLNLLFAAVLLGSFGCVVREDDSLADESEEAIEESGDAIEEAGEEVNEAMGD